MASSNFPPMHVGMGIFDAFSQTLFHRLLSSTFVGRARSLNNFRTSSTAWLKVSMRSVMLCVGADIFQVLLFSGNYAWELECAFQVLLFLKNCAPEFKCTLRSKFLTVKGGSKLRFVYCL